MWKRTKIQTLLWSLIDVQALPTDTCPCYASFKSMFLRAASAAAFVPSLNARALYLSAPTALIVTPETLRPALREKVSHRFAGSSKST